MNKHLISLVAALLVGCGGGGGGGSSSGGVFVMPSTAVAVPTAEAPKPSCRLGVFGDSVFYGGLKQGTARLGLPMGDAIRQARPKIVVTDNSVNGASAWLYMPRLLNEPMPYDAVIIQYGMNDVTADQPYEEQMRSIIARAKSFGSRIILTGISGTKGDPFPKWADYNEIVRRLPQDAYANWPAVPYADADMDDQVHPGQAYSTRLVEATLIAIDKALPECK